MALTEREVRSATLRSQAYKLADGGGIYLLCATTGAKYWRLKYRFAGKEKLLAFGVSSRARAIAASKRGLPLDDPEVTRVAAAYEGQARAALTCPP
jgi:hypothetical protein